MKRIAFALLVCCLGALSASATQISLIASFGDSGNPLAVSDIGSQGDTIVTFATDTYSLNCSGVDLGLCGSTATLSSTTLNSASSFTITLGANLVYVANTGWVVDRNSNTASILTTGVFYNPADQPGTSTPGTFNFSMPLVLLDTCSPTAPGCSNFSAQGVSSPVPEPGSLGLLGSGLIGLGWIARRRRKA